MSAGIGVFVCSFAGGKNGNLDVRALAAHARSLSGVAWAEVINDLCKDSARPRMVSRLKESGVDRFVVAACSPLVHERRLMSIAAEAGLNPFMFTVANVREQAALVHPAEEARPKAELLVSMAVGKCSLLAPAPFDSRTPESRSVTVVGDGIRAAVAATALKARGLEVVIVSPSVPLRLPLLFDDELGRSLKTGKKVRALKGEVVEVDGAPGAFEVLLEGGERAALRCGAIVVAFDPAPIDIAVGAKRLEEMIQSNKVPASVGIVADSWNPASSPPELDRVLSYSFRLKAARPDAQILIVVRDIHASGAIEELQREAQKAGVSFARSEQPPKIGRRGSAEIVAHDQVLGPLSFRVDEVVDLRSERNEECARACAVLGIATRPDGTPREAKARLEGGESLKGGVFVFDAWTEWCAADVLLDSSAIAGRVQELLGSPIEEGGAIAQVEEGKCSACLTCVRICPYGAPRMNDDMKAIIKFELCQGCGMCVTACPSKAIDMHCYSDQQLATEAHAALGGRR